jgi:hypothetical protein
MTITEALRTHLLADAAIAALVGTRCYPLRLPQKVTMPAIVLSLISGGRPGHLRGVGGLARARYQLDSWAQTYDGATALAAVCRQRLDGFAGEWTDGGSPAVVVYAKVFYDTGQDRFETEILGGLARHSADYLIHHSTAGGTL